MSMQGKKVVPCRFDWHQTGTQVIISIYAKNAVPELSYVDANSTTVSDTIVVTVRYLLSISFQPNAYLFFPLQLNIHVIFEGEKEFEQKISLWGVSAATLSFQCDVKCCVLCQMMVLYYLYSIYDTTI